MSLYYGHLPVQSKSKKIEVSTVLKEKGIELLRAIPSQVHLFVLPFVDNSLWASFIVSLSAICFSLANKTVISANLEGYRIDVIHDSPLPINYPNICIEVTNYGPKTHQWLLDNYFEEQEIRGKRYYLLPDPLKENLNALLDDSCPVQYKDLNYTPYGYANMGAVLAFSEIVNLLSYCLQALSAPLWAGSISREHLVPKMKKKDATTAGQSEDVLMPDVEKSTSTSGGIPVAHELTSFFGNPDSLSKFPSDKLLVSAKSVSLCTGWSEIPTILSAPTCGHGLLARYIRELSDDDPFGVPHFLIKYMRRSLGNSASEIIETVERFRSSWGILKTTSSGHILSHLVKTMDVAIEANCAITALFENGHYEGALIQGLGFVISSRNGDYISRDPEDLLKDLNSMETHEKAYEGIRAILDAGEVDLEKIPDELRSMNALRLLLLSANINEDDREKTKVLATKLRFPIRKWSINGGTITKLLDTISRGDVAIDRDFPIGPEGLFSKDPLEIVMSCFNKGSCPSFRHPSGVPINLRSSKPPSAPTVTKQRGSKGPQQINNGGWIFSVRRVEYNEAVSDFRIMIQEGEARSMSSSAARNLGYFVISGGMFDKTFMKLKECLSVVNEGGLGKSEEKSKDGTNGSKRVLSGEIPGGASKRPRKLMI